MGNRYEIHGAFSWNVLLTTDVEVVSLTNILKSGVSACCRTRKGR
ncbi:hypothetical protein [Desulfonatronum parangueonense]